MKRNQLFCIFSACIVFLVSAGCNKNTTTTIAEQAEGNSGIVVGFSMATLLEDRWIQDRDLFMSKAQEKGITVNVKNANKNSDMQYEQVCEMLDQGIDVLMIAPNDSEKDARCVEVAKSRGVPVISYDRLVFHSDVDVFVSFDNEQVGILMAQYLLEQVPQGGYLMVCGASNDSNSLMVRNGFMKTFEQEKGESAGILDETWIEGWVREDAFDFVAESTRTYKDKMKAVMCGNDSLAWGAIDALSESSMADGVTVVGMDADLSACQRIVEGKQGMTVYKPISTLVEAAVEICVQLADGGIASTLKTIDNGYKQVLYLPIEVLAVTAENMDEVIINGGFHLKDEVYKNNQT